MQLLKRLFYVSILMYVIPDVATAHTRWFAEPDVQPFRTAEPTGIYLTLLFLAGAIVISIGYWLEKRGRLQLKFLLPRGPQAFERAASAFTMMTGAFLLIAATHQYFFSPNLSQANAVPLVFIAAQFVIGLAFLLGIYARLAALMLAALWMLGILVIGVVPLLEDFWVLTTAAFIFIMGNDYFSLVSFRAVAPFAHRYRAYALPILRFGAGATLFILGFSEKILHPEFGVNFLSRYDWNFMALTGLPYSDYLFTLSAGTVESLFGLVFMLGILTRFNAVVVAIVFTLPIFLLGPLELAGHLPHFAAIFLLLLFGAGNHFKLVQAHKGQ